MTPQTRRPALLLWGAGWFVVLIASVTALSFGVQRGATFVRERDALDQLRQLQGLLREFKARYGEWPAVNDPAQLLSAFWGKIDARGSPTAGRWMLYGARLYFRRANPLPPRGVIIDPWGRPYVYCYFPRDATAEERYILFSSGPDGRYSSPRAWRTNSHGDGPGDGDNLAVWGLSPDASPSSEHVPR